MTEFKNNTTMTEANVEDFVKKWNAYCDRVKFEIVPAELGYEPNVEYIAATDIFKAMSIYEKYCKKLAWDYVNGFRRLGWDVKINAQNFHLIYQGRL